MRPPDGLVVLHGARTGAGESWLAPGRLIVLKSSKAGALKAECSRSKAATSVEMQAALSSEPQTEMLCRQARRQWQVEGRTQLDLRRRARDSPSREPHLVGEGVAAASSEPGGQGTSAECKGQRIGSSLGQEDQNYMSMGVGCFDLRHSNLSAQLKALPAAIRFSGLSCLMLVMRAQGNLPRGPGQCPAIMEVLRKDSSNSEKR